MGPAQVPSHNFLRVVWRQPKCHIYIEETIRLSLIKNLYRHMVMNRICYLIL